MIRAPGRLGLLAAAVVALSASASPGTAQPGGPLVTHGVVVGDVTATSAVLWARADRPATLNVALSGGGHGPIARVRVGAASDFTGTTELSRLRPATTYAPPAASNRIRTRPSRKRIP